MTSAERHDFQPRPIFFHDCLCQRPGCGLTRTHPRHQTGNDHA